MRVTELDPLLFRAIGGVVGIAFGLAAGRAADALPRRYGVSHLVTGPRRARRNLVLAALSALLAGGIAHVISSSAVDLSLAHAAFLLVANALVGGAVLAAAAIDLEHLILPNELTLGGALVCLATSPLRSIGLGGSLAGAALGFALTYLPFLLYRRVRGRSGMGLGDAKLAVTAGAWLGLEGVVFVLFAGALQSVVAAGVMRLLRIRYDEPESVKAEIAALRTRAEAGDEAARRELADDPMAGTARHGTLGMRLPLGPFLALGCIEVLFLRRWLLDHAFGWLPR
jgi:leader peptidase (prepilin peptidase)/N-methyltransferase